jgi:hypothetical protein
VTRILYSPCGDNVFRTPIQDDDIQRIYRVGNVTPGSTKIRPLLVGFKDSTHKEAVMQHLRLLSDASAPYKGISVSHDYTTQQRDSAKKAIEAEKLRRQNNGDSLENWKYRVVGMNTKVRVISLT